MSIKRHGKKVEKADLSLDLLEETLDLLPKTDGVEVPLLNLEESNPEKEEQCSTKFFKGRHPITKEEIYR